MPAGSAELHGAWSHGCIAWGVLGSLRVPWSQETIGLTRAGATMLSWGRGRGSRAGGPQAAHCLSPEHTLEWGWGLMMVPDIWRPGERTAYPGNQPPSPGTFFMPRNLFPPLLSKAPRPSVPPSPGPHHSSLRLRGYTGAG